MAHHVYQTKGLILESTNTGEANKYYSIFTEELGMIEGTAQGVRYLKSKLRFTLQQFNLINVSLVRGRSSWRIVNAEQIEGFYEILKQEPEKLHMVVRILKLSRRMIQGEEKNEQLFATLTSCFYFLKQNLTSLQIQNVEYIILLKILYALGYLASISELKKFIENEMTIELVEEMSSYSKQAIREINSSLKESQL